MKKQIIEKVIFFTLCLGSNLISTVWANADTKTIVNSDSILVSSGEIKNIVNNDFNIIDTTIQDEYGLSSNDGGILNINVDSLEIDHNIDKSNEFIGINAKGKDVQGNISSIDIATVNDINININAKEFGQISGLDIKDNAKLQMKAQDGDVNLKINMSIDRTLFDTHNSVISLQNNAEMSLSGNNIDIISTIDATSRQRSFNNYGLDIDNSKLDIQSKGNININTTATGNGFNNYGIHIQDIGNNSSNVNIISGGNLYLNSMDNGMNNESYGIYVENIDNSQTNTHLVINSNNNIINTKTTGIEAIGASSIVDLVAKKGSNVIKAIGDYDSTGIEANNNADINLVASENNIISADYTGIHVSYADEHHNNISLKAKNNVISSVETAILSFEKGNIRLEAIGGNNQINSNHLGISLMENSILDMNAMQGLNLFKVDEGIDILVSNSNLSLTASGNILQGIEGIANINQGNIIINADTKGNIIQVEEFGVYTKEKSTTLLSTKQADNIILVEQGIGVSGNDSDLQIDNQQGNNIIKVSKGIAIEANNGASIKLDTINGDNDISAKDIAVSVNKAHIDTDIDWEKNNTDVKLTGKNNNLKANIAIENINGGKVTIVAKQNNNIQGLVYTSGENTQINIKSLDGINLFNSAYINNAEDFMQNIYAENMAEINVEGNVNYIIMKDKNSEKEQRAIWANGATINIEGKTIIKTDDDIALLATNTNNLTKSAITANLNEESIIYGDIIADTGGEIKLKLNNKQNIFGVNIQGDIIAKNQGKVNIDIGNRSLITGNINDYMYLNYINDNKLQSVNSLLHQGEINLALGDNSRWHVVGQSFITEVETLGDNSIIDLVGSNKNSTMHSIMIDNFKGNSNFAVNLSGDRKYSDMLYLNSGVGEYNLILAKAVTSEDIGSNGLRFATVGDKNSQKFKYATAYDKGAFNVKYKIATEDYDVYDEENILYNNQNDNLVDELRPGNNLVNNIFGSKDTAANYKLVGIEDRFLSDAGKTILNMTKANYSMAVFMGRLDKRLGDIHYLQDNDGLWFRMRHDRIDKDLMFTIDSNMYELGYDKLTRQEDGQTRWGVALDYMQGSTIYDDIIGKGESDRRGLWLYNTWLGDDGHYSDYILKWGHLENDFAIYSGNKLDLITGKYDNNVYSASAEYGYKQDLGNNWFITPQAQIQLAKISGADYMTNQDTAVSVDGINSLIARLGFKIGKDFKDKSNFYLKADIIHEFWGEQFVSVKDKSSDDRVIGFNYDHSGTWYDIGLGFNIMTTDNSYVYMDYEKRFGNGNRNSYQINGGINWLF